MKILSIKESARHPKMAKIYTQLGIQEDVVNTIRKANAYIKSNRPDVIVTEFFYAYGTNYSSGHVSNLDMLFVTLQKYQCNAKIITFVDKSELQYIDKLIAIYPLDHFFVYPVNNDEFEQYLKQLCSKH
ncbi:MAG: hypothetical protein QM479_01545 [Pseudomonadota bacterium]